jgi:hypothetical protein
VDPGIPASKMELSTLIYKYTFNFLQNFKNLRALLPHGLLMLPCSVFKTIAGPLNIYQSDGFVPKHFDFIVQDVY